MRDFLQLLFVAVFVLVLGVGAYVALFEDDAEVQLVVDHVDGEVSINNGTSSRSPIAGESLQASDWITTGSGGRVGLSMGEGTRIELEAESRLEVIGSGENGLQVALANGRIRARVRPDGERLSVSANGREITAVEADFGVAVDGGGRVGVEAMSGEVTLLGFGEVESIGAGERILVLGPDDEPLVERVPANLLLEVEWPDEPSTSSSFRVRGITEPGALVWVDRVGVRVQTRAGSDGTFEIAGVPLEEGENSLTLYSEDIFGNTAVNEGDVERDSLAPTGVFEIRY